jgi:hypothetical protein
MIFKIESRFGAGDSRYEKPFHLAVCDKSSKYTIEHQIVSLLSRRKTPVVMNRLNCRVRRNSYSCWGIIDVLVDGQWLRWYSVYNLSQKPAKKKPLGVKSDLYFTMSGSTTAWGELTTATMRNININDL